ncbi:HD domain-containing protein [Actibacterium sp. 188UL27-1]|uniref:HD domain-containing protein n=1 Tax=Actibacterium sp. 188UL27-1 TaxID=2786961 RepID=UPI00195B386E|nr:HD domain-containing protein [Actibacterium sp. 188UL27-1]MBM7068980.1 HD domain-containing protein [Actibacterium sp. 188UL27-1]
MGESQIDRALHLARDAHRGQVDKLGVDYLKHVEAVAEAVRHLGEVYQITALLHDSIEDCDDRDVVSLKDIADLFGVAVADAVDCMTKRPDESYDDGYLPRVLRNEIARQVKLADVRHNRSRLHLLSDPATRDRLQTKYDKTLAVLTAQS